MAESGRALRRVTWVGTQHRETRAKAAPPMLPDNNVAAGLRPLPRPLVQRRLYRHIMSACPNIRNHIHI